MVQQDLLLLPEYVPQRDFGYAVASKVFLLVFGWMGGGLTEVKKVTSELKSMWTLFKMRKNQVLLSTFIHSLIHSLVDWKFCFCLVMAFASIHVFDWTYVCFSAEDTKQKRSRQRSLQHTDSCSPVTVSRSFQLEFQQPICQSLFVQKRHFESQISEAPQFGCSFGFCSCP